MAPVFKTEPRPYQRRIVEETWKEPSYALFLEQGLGKTKVVLDTAASLAVAGDIDALVVVSRKTVIENWASDELPKHLGVPYRAYLYSTASRKKLPPAKTAANLDGFPVLLINDGCLRTAHGKDYVRDFLANTRALLVVDESTLLKSPSAKFSRTLLSLAKKAPYRRILSGEPAPLGPVDYYNQYRFLDPAILGIGSFQAYKNIFCEMETVFIGGGRTVQKPLREFTPVGKELFEERVKPYTVRLRKADVLDDLPPAQFQTYRYTPPPKLLKQYHQLEKQYQVELEEEFMKGTLTATLAAARATRLHQFVCGHAVLDDGRKMPVDSGRYEVLREILDQRPPTSKTLIWCHYRHTVEELRDKLAEDYGEFAFAHVYGGMTDVWRAAEFKRFKADPRCRGIILNQATAGWGVTLTEADAAIYYANSYNWEHRVQSEARIHRIGQKSSVMYWDIVAEGTVDEVVLRNLQDKGEFSKAAMAHFNPELKGRY